MGGDGGSIPGRQDLVKTKKKREEASREDQAAAKWKHCALSQVPLSSPIVACELGRLYNKEAILEKLLDSKKYPNNHANHIKRLKDVKELNFTKSACDSESHGGASNDVNKETFVYVCPIVGVEMNGIHRFVFLWTCGCVFSEKAINTLKDNTCFKCGATITPTDVITLNPSTEDDINRMKTLMEARRMHQKRKSKKKPESKSPPLENEKKAENGEQTKNGHSNSNGKSSEIPGTSNHHSENSLKRKNRDIQNDPSKSKVFKSLFTTSEAAKNQPKGHWVTYNPFYSR